MRDVLEKEKKYFWKEYLDRFKTKNSIPYSLKAEKTKEKVIGSIEGKIQKNVFEKIDGAAINIDIKKEDVISFAWSVLIKMYTNLPDVLCKIEYKYMDRKESEILYRENFVGDESVEYLMSQAAWALEECEEYCFDDFNILLEQAGFDREDLLYSTILGFYYDRDKFDKAEVNNLDGAELKVIFDCSHEDSMHYRIYYYEGQITRKNVELIMKHFEHVLLQLCDENIVNLSDVELVCPEEKEEILYKFNDTKTEYPCSYTAVKMFENQVEERPNSIAIRFGNEEISYQQLNQKANRLARKLQKYNVGCEKVVAIMVERSIEMVVGILAILKTGSAYLPMDVSYPSDRVNYMMNNSQAVLLISEHKFEENIKNIKHVVYLDDTYEEYDDSNLEVHIPLNTLAYIIYTSGSTGLPKGVMVEHKQIINLLYYLQEKFQIQPNQISVQRTNITFDPSVWEILWPICFGGKMLLLDKIQGMDARYLYQMMRENNGDIIMIFMPSSLVKAILYIAQDEKKKFRMPYFHFGAEPITMDVLKSIYEYLDGDIIDTYGPTECTVFTTYYYISKDDPRTFVPIGEPIANTQIYILSHDLHLMPNNVIGEICIAGSNVSRGYMQNEEQTNKHFVKNPFGPGVLYHTGDLGRYLDDGNIEIMGRADNQVKIRGYRIELSEIEEVIISYQHVKDAIVIVQGMDDNKKLYTFVVKGASFKLTELKAFLHEKLPSYMVPSQYIMLDGFPTTVNGKVDRKKLLKLIEAEEQPVKMGALAEGENSQYKEIVEIIANVLSFKGTISLEDELADIGLNSINMLRVIIEIQKKYQITLINALKEFIRNKTVGDICSYVYEALRED